VKLKSFSHIVEQVSHETENNIFKGQITSINAKTNKFTFKTDGDENISGVFSEETKDSLRELHISPFDETEYNASFIKEIIKLNATNRPKIHWILSSVKKVPQELPPF